MTPGWISLTTDYGLSDGFVAVVHGVILRHDPDLRIIDVTHEVHPGDIARGAIVLAEAVPFLPSGVHIAVVDPGVGTQRRGIAIRTAGGLLVGPDNGVLWPAAEALGGADAAVELDNPAWHRARVSATFHGRDIFAPVAARLATGQPFGDAGTAIDLETLVRLPEPQARIATGELEAEVRMVDRFGNVQLHLDGDALSMVDDEVSVLGQAARRVRTFGDAPRGSLVVLTDSSGKVAIAINGGRAVVALGVVPGDSVRITNRVAPSAEDRTVSAETVGRTATGAEATGSDAADHKAPTDA
jgi:S-adenosylmethionine hydrolase